MLDIEKLQIIDPSNLNLKQIIPKNKGIYFWFKNVTNEPMYIGTGSGVRGLYNRIIGQHLNSKYIEYRPGKGRSTVRDAYQLKYPIIRERDGALGIDQSSFRRSVGSTFNIKPGIHTVNYIKENFYLKYFEIEDKEELMILEKQLIRKHDPLLNIDHKHKISNRIY
jgi:excinuclease UvrABC nuclease subunit